MTSSDDDKTVGEKIEEALNDAIAEALAKFEGSFAIKWVSMVEVMQPDGDRGLWTFTSNAITRWDTMAMLLEGVDRERANHMAHIIVDHIQGV